MRPCRRYNLGSLCLLSVSYRSRGVSFPSPAAGCIIPSLFPLHAPYQVITALHGVTRLAIASRAPDSMAAVKMLKLMELHAFFRLPLSQSSPPRGQGADEKTETQEERGIGPQEPQELIAIANDGWGKTKHLRDILRYAFSVRWREDGSDDRGSHRRFSVDRLLL